MPTYLKNLPEKFQNTLNDLSLKYDFFDEISKGNNGYVIKALNKVLSQKVIIKFYYWGDGAHLEPKYLCDLSSPYILKIFDACAIDDEDAYFVTEHCESGDLKDYITKNHVGLINSVDIIQQIMLGINDIHSKQYVHRDLKLSNIFLNNSDRFVIGDFGSVAQIKKSGYAQTGSKHSLIYRTPEEVKSGRAYYESDIYQAGIVLYQLLGGHLPYDESDWLNSKQREEYNRLPRTDAQFYATSIIEEKILKGKIVNLNSLPPWVPPVIVRFIRKCCKVDWNTRFRSTSDFIGTLNNLRNNLPDWRLEPEATLYRKNVAIRILQSGNYYSIQKKSHKAISWRNVREARFSHFGQAVEAAEAIG